MTTSTSAPRFLQAYDYIQGYDFGGIMTHKSCSNGYYDDKPLPCSRQTLNLVLINRSLYMNFYHEYYVTTSWTAFSAGRDKIIYSPGGSAWHVFLSPRSAPHSIDGPAFTILSKTSAYKFNSIFSNPCPNHKSDGRQQWL